MTRTAPRATRAFAGGLSLVGISLLVWMGSATAVTSKVAPALPTVETPLLLYVTADPEARGVVVQATIIGVASDAVGRDLQARFDGDGVGARHVDAYEPGDATVCDAPERLLTPALPRAAEAGALLGTFDPNPAQRFTMQPASADLRATLLSVLRASQGDAPAMVALNVQPHSAQAWRVSDQMPGGRDTALVTIAAVTQADDTGPGKAVLFAVLLQDAAGGWTLSRVEQDAGCAHCDTVPATTRPQAVGDFDGDGRLDLLLEDSGYESWTYRWLKRTGVRASDRRTDDAGWIGVNLRGGGGC